MLDDTSRVSTKSSSFVDRESAPQNTATVKDYMVLSIVVMIILGDGIEFYLPGVITQNVSCDLGLSEVEESVLAVMYYFFHAITVMISLPISKRFGERMTLLLSLTSVLVDFVCNHVRNSSQLFHTPSLEGFKRNMCRVKRSHKWNIPRKARVIQRNDHNGFFLGWGQAMPVGGTWVSLLAWLILDLFNWRVLILITSIRLFIPQLFFSIAT